MNELAARTRNAGRLDVIGHQIEGENFLDPHSSDTLRAEFIRYIYTQEGQKVVVKDGYFPVSRAIGQRELAKVGLAQVQPAN